ncbi:MAG: thiolase family protein [Calditrichaeota bacterium]|nr:MAG: thiolase family protein [Calditrichota bacterium]MBL1205666.1 thiolase family protein [Calditrichota bacterium]NOG45494.1 thiolase family protein [Calditrichota bacterium]
MKNVVIVDGLRTPYAKMGTAYNSIPAHELGGILLKEFLERMELNPAELDEVIIGNVAQPPEATNIARNIALLAGVPEAVPAFSVQRNCSSGMQSISDAWYRIQAGDGNMFLSGGVESMTKIPLIWNEAATRWFASMFKARSMGQKVGTMAGFKMKFLTPVVGLQLGLTDGFCGMNMGDTAELLAREFKIGREEQDQFAMLSHNRAEAAQKNGFYKDELMPVSIPPKYEKVLDSDNGVREGQNMQALTKLRPVFDKHNGTVTAGNASQITDGAAVVLVMEEEKAKEMGYKPIGRIKSFAYAGLDPKRMGLGPAYSTKLALEKAGMTMKDIERVEINEAFAAQVIANMRIFESAEHSKKYLDMDKALGAINPEILNVNGGAIALGHPVGSSGTRLVHTLLRELKNSDKNIGLATLCVGGGQGAAFILERMN